MKHFLNTRVFNHFGVRRLVEIFAKIVLIVCTNVYFLFLIIQMGEAFPSGLLTSESLRARRQKATSRLIRSPTMSKQRRRLQGSEGLHQGLGFPPFGKREQSLAFVFVLAFPTQKTVSLHLTLLLLPKGVGLNVVLSQLEFHLFANKELLDELFLGKGKLGPLNPHLLYEFD